MEENGWELKLEMNKAENVEQVFWWYILADDANHADEWNTLFCWFYLVMYRGSGLVSDERLPENIWKHNWRLKRAMILMPNQYN